MKITRRRLLSLSVLSVLSPFAVYSSSNIEIDPSLKDIIKKNYGDKDLEMSSNINLTVAGNKLKYVREEWVYFAENSAVIPFTININDVKYNSILLLSENPNTHEFQKVAKYNVSESIGNEISGRLKLNCKHYACNIWAIANTDSGVIYDVKYTGAPLACTF